MSYLGIDHIDLRVPALGVVEAFYDALLRRLGLTVKSYSLVERGGASWREATAENYNAVEWYEEHSPAGRPRMFFGVIEEQGSQPAKGRIAFAVPADSLDDWERVLPAFGAREVERGDETYPAVFFTDPLGTRLELCARRPRA